jgi:DeoR/GlpR family transcriptional regulator of sugar metabolism
MLHPQDNMDRNRKIGALAAGMVQDGETQILDAGTTMSEVATPLTARSNLTIPGNAKDMPGGQFKELIHSCITGDGISDADAKEFERGIEVLIAK